MAEINTKQEEMRMKQETPVKAEVKAPEAKKIAVENAEEQTVSEEKNKSAKKAEKKALKDKKKKKTKSSGKKIAILATLSFLLTAGVIYFLMALPGKADEIRMIRTQSLAYRINGQDEVLLVKSLKETEAEREKLMQSFPSETTLLSFIKLMEGLRTQDVEILKSSLDSDMPTKIGKSSSFLPVTLMLEGKEDKVNEALKKIVESPYFIKVVNFSKEYDSNSEQVIVGVQFHLFVADEF